MDKFVFVFINGEYFSIKVVEESFGPICSVADRVLEVNNMLESEEDDESLGGGMVTR
ncbi:hypothetical protein RYX36_010039, partial [Vicia faba]